LSLYPIAKFRSQCACGKIKSAFRNPIHQLLIRSLLMQRLVLQYAERKCLKFYWRTLCFRLKRSLATSCRSLLLIQNKSLSCHSMKGKAPSRSRESCHQEATTCSWSTTTITTTPLWMLTFCFRTINSTKVSIAKNRHFLVIKS